MSNETKYAAPPDEFPENGSSGSGTDTAYSVQARMAYITPKVVAGQLLDLRWTKIHFDPARNGVPVREGLFPQFRTLGLLSYQAAQAMRWWFIAAAAKDHDHLCLETRLVEHEVKYSYSAVAARACEVIGAGDDRRHMMPERTPTPAQDAVKR